MTIFESVEPFLRVAGESLSSNAALLTYSWIGIGVVVAASVYFGTRRFFEGNRRLSDDIRSQVVKPGPVPTKEETILARKQARNVVLKTFLRQLGITALFIIGVPLVAVLIVTIKSAWFFPGQTLFVGRATGDIITSPSNFELSLFFLDQILKGALFDFMEVFRVQLSAIENSTSNWWYSGLVLGFRILLDAFALAIAAKMLGTMGQLFMPLRLVRAQN